MGCVVVTRSCPRWCRHAAEPMAMGVDEVSLSAREFGGSDTYATSQILPSPSPPSVWRGRHRLCGRQAIDGDTAQVGPQIAGEAAPCSR